MKALFVIILGLCGLINADAQVTTARVPVPTFWTAEELDELFAPIALYPDTLLALILSSATKPADIARAAAYIEANGDLAQAANQPWDKSVKSLALYPNVLLWMSENVAWTQEAGEAYLAQPADVMDSVQRLRARSNPPTRPEIIYVPYYDRGFGYETWRYRGSWPSFNSPFRDGTWLYPGFGWVPYGITVGGFYPGLVFRRPARLNPLRVGVPVTKSPPRPPAVVRPPNVRPKPITGARVPPPNPPRPVPTVNHPANPPGIAPVPNRGIPALVTRPGIQRDRVYQQQSTAPTPRPSVAATRSAAPATPSTKPASVRVDTGNVAHSSNSTLRKVQKP